MGGREGKGERVAGGRHSAMAELRHQSSSVRSTSSPMKRDEDAVAKAKEEDGPEDEAEQYRPHRHYHIRERTRSFVCRLRSSLPYGRDQLFRFYSSELFFRLWLPVAFILVFLAFTAAPILWNRLVGFSILLLILVDGLKA